MPPAHDVLANRRTMKGGGAAGMVTPGAAGVEVAQSILAADQTAILPLVPYLDTLPWVFIAVALAVLLSLLSRRLSGEGAGRLAKHLETTGTANDVQRRMRSPAGRWSGKRLTGWFSSPPNSIGGSSSDAPRTGSPARRRSPLPSGLQRNLRPELRCMLFAFRHFRSSSCRRSAD